MQSLRRYQDRPIQRLASDKEDQRHELNPIPDHDLRGYSEFDCRPLRKGKQKHDPDSSDPDSSDPDSSDPDSSDPDSSQITRILERSGCLQQMTVLIRYEKTNSI
jgi:hypothetical protein